VVFNTLTAPLMVTAAAPPTPPLPAISASSSSLTAVTITPVSPPAVLALTVRALLNSGLLTGELWSGSVALLFDGGVTVPGELP